MFLKIYFAKKLLFLHSTQDFMLKNNKMWKMWWQGNKKHEERKYDKKEDEDKKE